VVDADRVRRKVFMYNGRGGQHLHDGVDKTRVSEVWQAHVTVHLTISQHGTLTTRATKNSAIAKGPRDASCQLKSFQLPRNSAECTCTTPT